MDVLSFGYRIHMSDISKLGTDDASQRHVKLKRGGTNALAVRGDGRLVAAAAWDGRVRLYSLPKVSQGKKVVVVVVVVVVVEEEERQGEGEERRRRRR